MVQAASLYTSIVLESSSFVTPLRNVLDETEKASRKMVQEQERLAKSADRLLSSVDPVHAAQSRYNKAMVEAERLHKAGAISSAQLAQVEQSHKQALDAVTRSLTAHNAVSAQSQQRMRLLGYQISDIGVQLAGGQNPFLILAQQGPQVANALEGMNNRIGKVAAFLSGPWGAALLAAGTAAGVFASKLWESRKAAEAKEKATKTLEEALDELDRVTGRTNKTAAEQIRLSEEAARKKYNEVVATREKIKALLEEQRLVLESQMLIPSGAGDAAAMAAERAFGEVKRLTGEIAEQDKRIAEAQEKLRGAISARVLQQVTEKMDAAAAATGRYERAHAALRKEFEASEGAMDEAEYARREEALRRVRDAEIKAAEEASKKRVQTVDKELNAINSLIGRFLAERTAIETYAERLDLLDKGLQRGRLSADELALAIQRVRGAMLDDLGLEKIGPKITDFDADKVVKKGLPKFDARELLDLDSVRGFSEEIDRTAERARRLDQAAMQFATNMTSSFEDAIFAGKGLRSVFTGLLEDMAKMVIRLTVMEPLAQSVADALKGSGGPGGGGGGNLFTWIGSLFGGARANGGPVTGGRTYLVGERGPELFTAPSSGNIIPNGALRGLGGGRAVEQHFHVNAQGAILAQGLVAEMQAIGMKAAVGGGTMAQQDMARRARRSLRS